MMTKNPLFKIKMKKIVVVMTLIMVSYYDIVIKLALINYEMLRHLVKALNTVTMIFLLHKLWHPFLPAALK